MADKDSFDAYVAAYERELAAARKRLSADTLLHLVDRLALKLAYVFSKPIVGLSASPEHEVIRHCVSQLTNELMAFSGCVRHGSLHGAWHHVRAIQEIEAALHYVFCDTALTDKRARQFVEHARLYPWARKRVLELDLAAKKITPEQFARLNIVSDALIADVTPQVIAEWVALFGEKNADKLAKRQKWHDGSIKDRLLDLDPEGRAYRSYEHCCQATHVSPLGHRLSSPRAPRLFGYDPPNVSNAIDSAFGRTYEIVKKLHAVLGDTFADAVVGDIHAFVDARMGSTHVDEQPPESP